MKHFSKSVGRLSLVNFAILCSVGALHGCGGGGGDAATAAVGSTPSTTTGSAAGASTTTTTGTGTSATSNGANTTPVPTPPSSTATNSNIDATATEAAVAAISEVVDSSPAWIQSAGSVIANFDNDTIPAWTYIPGSEFPGSLGSMVATTGVAGTNGVRLNYDLGCSALVTRLRTTETCGRYVAMTKWISAPVSVASSTNAVLAFDTKSPQGVGSVLVRVVDSTGQTLQFSTNGRSLEASSGEQWQKVHLPISKSTNHFGGANDGILHAPIIGVTMGLGELGQIVPSGWVDFDNIAVLSAPTYNFELKPTAPVASGSFYPSYVGRLSINTYTSNPTAHDKALSVGINTVRRDLFWNTVEANGKYDFTTYNAAIEALRLKGMRVLWILDYGHPDHGGNAPITDADRTAFANFAKAAALNFKGKNIVGFEIWNEPNTAHFWPNPDATAYAKLFNKAATEIRAADPSAKIISGGTSGIDIDYSMKIAANISPNLIDVLAVHPYNKLPEGFTGSYVPLKQSVAVSLPNKPIWDTEWGFSSYGDFDAATYGNGYASAARDRQAVLLLRRVLTELGLNIPFMNIYSLTDYGANPLDREANFGVLTQDASEKPAFVALRSLYAAQTARVFKGFLPDVPPGVHVLRWDGTKDKAFVIWSEVPGQKVTIKLPSKLKSVRWWNEKDAAASSATSLTIEEKNGPVFVTVDR